MEEQHKELIRRLVEGLNDGDWNVIGEILDPDYRGVIRVDDAEDQRAVSPAEFTRNAESFRAAFPDWRITIVEMIAEGNKVTALTTGRGTHEGRWRGIDRTGRAVTVDAVTIYTFADSKIKESRGILDRPAILDQLTDGITDLRIDQLPRYPLLMQCEYA